MTQSHALTVTHDIFVPREVVFEAWTSADHLVEWYSPGAGYARRAEVDLQPGGRLYVAWSKSGGESVEQEAVITAVDPPAQISYDVQALDSASTPPSRVTVELVDLGGRTRIEVHQEGVQGEDVRERHAARWRRIFEQLENYLSSI